MAENKKCQNCGGVLLFDPTKQKMFCKYCRTEREIIYENEQQIKEETKNLDLYTCPSCGAQIVCDNNTTSTFCVYCRNMTILKEKLKGEFHPQSIIPFQKTKEDAIKAFELLHKNQKLVPNDFLTKDNIKEIRGVYIPFWLMDINVKGSMKAKTKITKMVNAASESYTESVKKFNSTRDGEIGYKLVPVDGSTHFDDDIMQSIEPFNYENLKPYSSDYLAGFLSEIYDVKSDDALTTANKRIEKSAYEIFRKSLIGSTPTDIEVEEFKYTSDKVKEQFALLPVYLLNVKYKNKLYTFAMNGQTGKMIGNLPSSKKEEFIYFLIRFIIISIIVSIAVGFINMQAYNRLNIIIGLIISLILAFIFLQIEKKNLKMVKKDPKINEYINDRLIEQRNDKLVNTNTIVHDYSRANEVTLAGSLVGIAITGLAGGKSRR